MEKIKQPKIGNYTKKYNLNNRLLQITVNQYKNTLFSLIKQVKPQCDSVLDVGCGEGTLSLLIQDKFHFSYYRATDLREKLPDNINKKLKRNEIIYKKDNITETKLNKGSDLVLCLEVLEHVKNPKEALINLIKITNHYLLISIPIEPLWRILNIARLKYLRNFGNTPGHVNHWGCRQFRNFLQEEVNKTNKKVVIRNSCISLPWQFYLLKIEN